MQEKGLPSDPHLLAREVEQVDTLVVADGHHPPTLDRILTSTSTSGDCGETGTVDAAAVGERCHAGIVGCFE